MTVQDLRKLIAAAPRWQPPEKAQKPRQVFVDFPEFATASAERIDCLVEGVIQRGANGFIAADPKGSKSFCAADLAIALATGTPWLGFPVLRPVRVGMVSREDNPALTSWRLKHLMQGRDLNVVQLHNLEQNLYVNSRAQTPTFMLDNEAEVNELIAAVKERQLEFLILDVFNILHAADENDNSQMAAVLSRCRHIQAETGASMGILHHFHKGNGGSITQRLRGASAIAGFAEWIIGLSVYDEESRVRKMEFESKAGAPDPLYFCITAEEGRYARIQRVSVSGANVNVQGSLLGVN